MPNILYALSDPIRLEIVAQVAKAGREISCAECIVDEHMAKSTQSHHFKVLREAGVTHSTPYGTRIMIKLRKEDLEARFPGLLESVLRSYEATRQTPTPVVN